MKSEALQHVLGQRPREITDVLLPEDGWTAEREALFDVWQFQNQKPVRSKQHPERLEESAEITDMFQHMSQVDRVERTAIGDDLRRTLLGQVTGVDLVALLAGERRGHRIGLAANALCLAGATQTVQA